MLTMQCPMLMYQIFTIRMMMMMKMMKKKSLKRRYHTEHVLAVLVLFSKWCALMLYKTPSV